MLLDVLLVTDSSNKVDFLPRKGLSALLEHVGVADVEGVEDTVCVYPQDLLFCHKLSIIIKSWIIPGAIYISI